jgi:hypothetical protein
MKIQTLEDIIEYMVRTEKNPLIVDTWGTDEETNMFKIIDQNFNSSRELILGKFKLYTTYTSGVNCGMCAEPPVYKLFILLNFENKA